MVDKNITWHEGNVSRKDRESITNQRGRVLWFTGLSGSGKSTIAVELEKKLTKLGNLVFRLDGDNIRHGLNKDLGFSSEERTENIRRIAEVAKLFCDSGVIVLASFISPLIEMRELAKEIIGNKDFVEIFVKAEIDTCKKRDPKGLYEKVIAGEIKGFSGIDAPYEVPCSPDLLLDTDNLSLTECVLMVETAGLVNMKNKEVLRESHLRSILKGLTWRIVASITTIVISYAITGSIHFALKIGAIEVFAKILIYYFHERAWQLVPRGVVRKLWK